MDPHSNGKSVKHTPLAIVESATGWYTEKRLSTHFVDRIEYPDRTELNPNYFERSQGPLTVSVAAVPPEEPHL